MYIKESSDGTVSINATEALDGFVKYEGGLPAHRTYRNAWALVDGKVVIDLEKAKPLQKKWAAQKAYERCPVDLRGNPIATELEKIDAEIEAIDWDAIKTLDELYNSFPASIDLRDGKRKYPV